MSQSQMQSKRWTFTEFDIEPQFDCKYMIYGKEICPTTQKKHYQGYVIFEKNKRLAAVKKLLPKAHWEIAKGTTEHNINYCSKDGDFTEIGTKPMTKKEQGELGKEYWLSVIKSAREGTVEQEHPQEFIRHYSTMLKLYQPVLENISEYSGHWFVGPPGTGKSKLARERFPGFYDKSLNKWWDGYQHEENVLIDDLSLDSHYMGTNLKRYVDHYPFRAEIKGGSMMIRPKNIVVTSNYEIEQIWPNDDQLVKALKRRFLVTRFYESFPIN